MAQKPKDRFRDWNLLHKAVVALIAAFFVSVAYRMIIVIDAGFEMEYEASLPYSAEAIWPWIYSPDRRSDWQAEVIDLTPYSGAPDKAESTRLVFYKRVYSRWHAMEQTTEVVPQRLYATIQESDRDQRWFRVELTPEGACSTHVRLYEVIMPKEYKDRFWFFTNRGEAQERLETSVKALDRWLADTTQPCEP